MPLRRRDYDISFAERGHLDVSVFVSTMQRIEMSFFPESGTSLWTLLSSPVVMNFQNGALGSICQALHEMYEGGTGYSMMQQVAESTPLLRSCSASACC